MSRYLDWIETRIAHHQREIAALTIAQKILGDADRELSAPVKVKAKAKTTKKKPGFGHVRKVVLETMAGLRPASSAYTIAQAVVAAHPDMNERQVWNALYHASRAGAVIRDDKLYSLPGNNPGIIQPEGDSK